MPYRGCHLLVFCRTFALKKYVNHIRKRLEPIVLGWSFLGSFLSFRLVCNFIKKEALGYAIFFEFCEHFETFFDTEHHIVSTQNFPMSKLINC